MCHYKFGREIGFGKIICFFADIYYYRNSGKQQNAINESKNKIFKYVPIYFLHASAADEC
jgi:hypothetical protein